MINNIFKWCKGQKTKCPEKSKIIKGEHFFIKHGELFSEFKLSPGMQPALPRSRQNCILDIPVYTQLDFHSCGFLAVHAVVRELYKKKCRKPDDVEILKAVNATCEEGCDNEKVIGALKKLGILAQTKDDLTKEAIFDELIKGNPIIVTVLGDGWECDHWTVIRGIDMHGYVFHSNLSDPIFGKSPKSSGYVRWSYFDEIWYDRGLGIVCS